MGFYADGKICAVEWTYNSITVMTGYIYDAEGNRVAKGAITTMSCDPSTNGFTTQADYVLDQAGHQLSEFVPGTGGAMSWQHTNVYASGELIATDDTTETHYYLNDWLGTRRVQTDYEGAVEQTCASLPYGDGETCAPTPTENLFTGKERDQESGLDYAHYRYYMSNLGRWVSPDPSGLFFADPLNPQSLNLYSYVGNEPLSRIDLMGLCWKGFDWACKVLNGIKNTAISAKNEFEYGEWTANTDLAQIRQNDRQRAADRSESYQKETGGNTPRAGASIGSFFQVPWEVSWILPLDPVPGVFGIGPAGSIVLHAKTHTACVSVGIGGSAGDNIAGGPLMGRTLNGKIATPSQIDKILESWSLNGGVNIPTGGVPVGPGLQGSVNGSGVVYGPTVGVAGFSLSSTDAYCTHY